MTTLIYTFWGSAVAVCSVKTLFSRNFCQKSVRVNFCFYHTVLSHTHTATADPQKVHFKVVTESNETHSFQKIYYFPDWNSSKPTLQVFWALRYRAVKLTKFDHFSSSILANFQKATKWTIFDIFLKFWTSVIWKSLNLYNLVHF